MRKKKIIVITTRKRVDRAQPFIKARVLVFFGRWILSQFI